VKWQKSDVGCFWWCKGDYAICTISGGGEPSGYLLSFKCERIGIFPTLESAQEAAERHESLSTDSR
jgi:hypothetical protein